MKDFRPISLCNVIYKIIAKVLANRMKHILSRIISSSQSAFAPGRSITDNVMIACELLHYMNRKQRGNVGEVALKLDISKAYDRVDWKFLHHMLQILGFDDRWIKWIMLCVTSVRYTVLMNGSEVGPIIPKRGLRQGFPLSPYLFIICAEGLSALLRQAESSGLINGSKVCRGAPSISHLFFADDSFLFFKSTEEETRVIHRILELYESYSGQAINLQKSSIMFSSNVRTDKQKVLSAMLGVTNGINTGKYLGLPSLIGRSKRATFSYIKDTIWKRIQGWRNKLLSQVGKGVLIKSVSQAIPTYSMSVFLLPVSVCDEIQKMMNSFWWGSSSGNGKGIRWQSWARLARAKELGGMGLCDL